MSKIENDLKDKKVFIGFLTAGDPSLEKTEEYIIAMANAGADLIEIGIPFSDPIAEGKVIEAANLRALSVGTTTDKIFDMILNVRKKVDVPLVFLTYLNPVFSYGYELFFKRCKKVGVHGIIIPDLPLEEQAELLDIANSENVDVISLIAPTSEKRVLKIAKDAKGFIYLVSSMGVTGVREEIKTNLQTIVTSIKSVTNIPVCVGFGISTPEQAMDIWQYADGVIVGSAIVRIIEKYGDNAEQAIKDYVSKMVLSNKN
ncbi:MAG: tryptophan synthase subunit alpha [Eubacteriaceae bacterium]